jgi:hypothetical protein
MLNKYCNNIILVLILVLILVVILVLIWVVILVLILVVTLVLLNLHCVINTKVFECSIHCNLFTECMSFLIS